MEITNFHSSRSISQSFFSNSGSLSITNLSFGIEDDDGFNPNMLLSKYIINQLGNNAVLSVENSKLIGSTFQLFLNGGSAQIVNCSFSKSLSAIDVLNLNSFTMVNSKLKNIGELNGPVSSLSSIEHVTWLNVVTAPISIFFTQNVLISQNDFSALDQNALLTIKQCNNISIHNNALTIDSEQFVFFNISKKTAVIAAIMQSAFHITLYNCNNSKIG